MWGALGSAVFSGIKTPNKETFKRKSQYHYEEINTLIKSKLQFINKKLEEIEFELEFNYFAGVDVEKEIAKLRDEANRNEPLTLIIGNKVIGKFVILEIEDVIKTTDRKGKLLSASVKVKLKEYN